MSSTDDLTHSRTAKIEAEIRFDKWNNEFLLKHLLKNKFETWRNIFETETAKIAKLEERLNLSSIATIIDIVREQAELTIACAMSLPDRLNAQQSGTLRLAK